MKEQAIIDKLDSFELLSTSTNRVYRFSDEGKGYIVKLCNVDADNTSPFWYIMSRVFGATPAARQAAAAQTVSLLDNPHIPIAQLVMVSERYGFQLFYEADGIKYEPDSFPHSAAMAYQLGQYIGSLHSRSYPRFGLPSRQTGTADGFKDAMLAAMSDIVRRYWQCDAGVHDYLDKIRDIAINPDSFSLIMTDISANQFTFSPGLDAIRAVVDFDAYVIGPRELELCIIELCLMDGLAFARGYERYLPLPNLTRVRPFYRFFAYICDPWADCPIDKFMDETPSLSV